MKNCIQTSDYIFDIDKGSLDHSFQDIRLKVNSQIIMIGDEAKSVLPGSLMYVDIPYNAGDETGSVLSDWHSINQVSDITVFSPELRQHCTDWPSLYHLSGTRANILRPFAAALTGEILEIGAGCGAITRYLGELGANVLALEGSSRRAAIARSRTRDLENVTVLVGKIRPVSM